MYKSKKIYTPLITLLQEALATDNNEPLVSKCDVEFHLGQIFRFGFGEQRTWLNTANNNEKERVRGTAAAAAQSLLIRLPAPSKPSQRASARQFQPALHCCGSRATRTRHRRRSSYMRATATATRGRRRPAIQEIIVMT